MFGYGSEHTAHALHTPDWAWGCVNTLMVYLSTSTIPYLSACRVQGAVTSLSLIDASLQRPRHR